MVQQKLFSYLSAGDYFRIFEEAGFNKLLAFAKISTKVVDLLKNKPEVEKLLDDKNSPQFDRHCSGLYFWMKNKRL